MAIALDGRRILGVDAGTVRIGLAISDPEGKFAFPLEVVAARQAISRIKRIIDEQDVAGLIVGLPLTMKGQIGPEGMRVEKFIEKLRKAIPRIPIETIDERLSSKEADRMILSPKNKSQRDAVAASLLLSTWLKLNGVTLPI